LSQALYGGAEVGKRRLLVAAGLGLGENMRNRQRYQQ